MLRVMGDRKERLKTDLVVIFESIDEFKRVCVVALGVYAFSRGDFLS